MSKASRSRSHTVSDFSVAMNAIAPTTLAQEWDNVGVLAGDLSAHVRRVLFAIDLTPTVTAEAIRLRADLLFCYHPPIFQPIKTLVAQNAGVESLVFQCVRNNIAVYSSHTALDAADGGTNDVIAGLCGIAKTNPLEFVDTPGEDNCKIVVFVPREHVDRIADAAFAAGAGVIGNYTHCSYRTDGTGTFFGTSGTNPAIGKRGRFEHVDEVRLEFVTPRGQLPEVVQAVRTAHPYDEPAFDIFPLTPAPSRGIGCVGELPKQTTLATLAQRLSEATKATNVSIVGRSATKIKRAIIVVGAAGRLPFRGGIGAGDVVITGEIRHHDALAFDRAGATAIALGHWTSERPILTAVIRKLKVALPGVDLKLSRADREPFARVK
jgi:dinuclear metal center YbgI/SA1388 family protein